VRGSWRRHSVGVSVTQPVTVRSLESAKCWSEWQDLNLRPPRPERRALPDRYAPTLCHPANLASSPRNGPTPTTQASCDPSGEVLHSEIRAKLLTDLGTNSPSFSECTLILQRNLSDFDSAIEAAGQPPCARRDDDRTRLGQRIGKRSRSPSVGIGAVEAS
jgi:hypothetical protein